ncbi:HD domain-containing phosphohydrolase [Thermosynechococcus sp. GLH187]|uniref:HD domain-containing phosphohydrolase n=1 Tax=unclassified Thermosynechococcus TaxID=2622553 RepID=UPI00287750DB|nr:MULTISPECIES: HD domain-containing phosphohydrolase [unclassified Thermosynechococcus]WNC44480.1 HD domain-containing phosphohydrolase [Thermosynechococcus sp. GLH187]WNC47016.1 HD domain-containing phosphohydrolase [Thermosynechococcus sp. GLH333]WNC49553.1 HD domain-containing phosphohydrolase [Thermosynechococcus sp. GLH87]
MIVSPLERAVLGSSAETLVDQLLEIGIALSASQSLEELLHLILTKSRQITASDAGTIFLVQGERAVLEFKAAQNDSVALPEQVQDTTVPLTPDSLVGYAALTGESLNIPDVYALAGNELYQFNRSFDEALRYRTCSVLVVPMQNVSGEVIGVLQLINRKRSPDTLLTPETTVALTQPYSPWEEHIVRSLASQAAVIIERNHLLESIEQLFEGFVTASVQAIEARDPTTAGHSERVAALTVHLAQTINETSRGVFREVAFSDRQLQEIRYAALLHDFGKVAVPEAILNKQKKFFPEQLEVIRQRFALVRRTLEMETAQAKVNYLLCHPHTVHSPEQACHHCAFLRHLDQELRQQLLTLEVYWQLLEQANEPQILDEEPLARLQELTQFYYRGTDGELHPLITASELEQLLVRRGNLTQQERRLIEAHVTYTYQFLSRIPWTPHLKNVPIIAYGHHERLNGSGYPRGIGAAEIPLQTQMLAIADIYDALTAKDRPYKKSLPVDAALEILWQEAKEFKINPDLVELFEQQEVFRVLGHQR